MAEKIKKFFAKKKADAKFKLAGPGHKLNESSTTVVVPPSKKKPGYMPSKLEPSEAARQAAEAALVRVSSQKKDTAFNTSLAAIQAKVRRELEAEKKDSETASVISSKPVETELELSAHLAVKGMLYRVFCELYDKLWQMMSGLTSKHFFLYEHRSDLFVWVTNIKKKI